jgi:chemotaxis signal transduction protein
LQLCSLALAVHSTRRIVPIDADALMPVDQERQETSCIRAVMNYSGEIINILDVPRLLARLEKQP